MATTVRDLPGVRLAARVHVFLAESDEAFVTRIDDLGDDWVAVAVSDRELLEWRVGTPIELEVPQTGGALFLGGTVAACRTEAVPLVVVRIEHVGADPGVGDMREQRRNVRVLLTLPLDRFAFRVGHGDWEEADATLRDLSAGGASVATDRAIPIGAHVRMTFPMLLEGWACAVHCTVMVAHESGSVRYRQHRLGLRFDDLPHQTRDWLVRQLHFYQTTDRR